MKVVIVYIHNEVLRRIVFYKPKSKYGFCSIDGLAPSIYKAFGEKIIELIKEFENNKWHKYINCINRLV